MSIQFKTHYYSTKQYLLKSLMYCFIPRGMEDLSYLLEMDRVDSPKWELSNETVLATFTGAQIILCPYFRDGDEWFLQDNN